MSLGTKMYVSNVFGQKNYCKFSVMPWQNTRYWSNQKHTLVLLLFVMVIKCCIFLLCGSRSVLCFCLKLKAMEDKLSVLRICIIT